VFISDGVIPIVFITIGRYASAFMKVGNARC